MDLSAVSKNQPSVFTANTELRKSTQFLMPSHLTEAGQSDGGYNIYPTCALGSGQINNGFASLAQWIIEHKTVVVDGYVGVFWEMIQAALQKEFQQAGVQTTWIKTADYLKPVPEIESMLEPFLGTYESVWGTRCTLTLQDFYDLDAFRGQRPDPDAEVNIIIGPGAALAGWEASVIYIDLPKNELQFRMRAGSITNLGSHRTFEAFYMYKRFYFVDWVVLNEHKKSLLGRIDVIADGQWPDQINWMTGDVLRNGLARLSSDVFRVRPWFEPGAWGGDWIKSHIEGVNTDVVNYAWSFELIVPENGLLFESDGWLLEVSFDMLMFSNNEQILGSYASTYGDEFPIRFDFLDTVDGGNLSIQCHPRLSYIQEHFGERITQDETYYILDCKPGATVYLGFQESIEPDVFRAELETSQAENRPVEIEKYVQAHEAQKHDLFLIPNGTVHSAGAGNLVLEISATPYIFTFKMYDWVRLDLEGKPRPINIDHAFNNLDFNRKGNKVQDELISKQTIISQNDDTAIVHLPTHPAHFYDVHRLEFASEMKVQLHGGCHVMMLVEGQSIIVETEAGVRHRFAYAETFVIPAAAKSYTLTNQGAGTVKVIKAFLK